MAVPYCRLLARGSNIVFWQRVRGLACIFALIVLGALSFTFYTKSSNEELEYLRNQLDLLNAQMNKLRNEVIDANVGMEKQRNSEFECKSRSNELESKLKACQASSAGGGGVDVLPQHQHGSNVWDRAVEKPQRGDQIPNRQRGSANQAAVKDPNSYPKLTPDGNFIPSRIWMHFDFKGAPPKPTYFISLLPFIKKMGVNGILVEWEDMFPYTGRLASAVNGDAYSMQDVEKMLQKAKELQLEVVPLVQTFGHLEWVLKLEQFAHLREDPQYPQVICFGSSGSWELLTQMMSQVAEVHKRFGMNYFHIGADEVFQVGVCNQSLHEIRRQGGRDKAILWHISRTASFVKDKFSVNVLAWHDHLVQMPERELLEYNLPETLEPVLWSYAEDLDTYLPFSNWISLKPFKNVWGSSAFKGADGPMRFNSNPGHYIRNHESWIEQMTRVYKEFDLFQGLIITGWSRYDHLATLCELFPIAIPTLAMCVETIRAGRPLGGFYEKLSDLLQCNAPQSPGFAFGCKFPGNKVYELVNEFAGHSQQLRKYVDSDFDFNGWLSVVAEKWNSSSPMYIQKVMPYIDYYLRPLERIERDLREEMLKHFYPEAVEEFILAYMSRDLELLRSRKMAAKTLLKQQTFPRRPFVKYAPLSRQPSAESSDGSNEFNHIPIQP